MPGVDRSTLLALKSKSRYRLKAEKETVDRQRNVMILILQHLTEEGHFESVEQLQREAGVSASKFDVADNMDLVHVVQEFENYHELRFDKKPTVIKRRAEPPKQTSDPKSGARRRALRQQAKKEELARKIAAAEAKVDATDKPRSAPSRSRELAKQKSRRESAASASASASTATTTSTSTSSSGTTNGTNGSGAGRKQAKGLSLAGNAVQGNGTTQPPLPPQQPEGYKAEDVNAEDREVYTDRLLKPLPYAHNKDLRTLAETITRDIYVDNPNVHWGDVVGLDRAKRLLKEAVVMPIMYPQLFTGLLSPWKGVLLYGPPGTGKTMLAKAVATECHTTFFNISASSIVSKWRGDSEKLVRMLFDLARYHAPSTIFVDEIDSMMGQRGGGGGGGGGGREHESSRRMKTELLIQMDGLAKTDDLVFLLAASNLPWQLDFALLRRLEKRVLVPLPDEASRQAMVRMLLPPDKTELQDSEYATAAARTQGFSGADLKLMCKEAAMRPLRRLMDTLDDDKLTMTEADAKHVRRRASPRSRRGRGGGGGGGGGDAEEEEDPEAAAAAEAVASGADLVIQLKKVVWEDVEAALGNTRPAVQIGRMKYEKWAKEFGAT